MIKHLLFAALIVGGIYHYWATHPVSHGPGVVAPKTPVQEKVYNADQLNFKDIDITPKAKFHLEARILSIEHYYFDTYSDVTTTDIVFGWGPMSDEKNLESLMVRQSDRSFHWEIIKPPIKQEKMWNHASNMHLIGSTQALRDKISALRQGQIVEIDGYLVNAKSPKGWKLTTSLSRKDRGKNSNEVVWIKSLTIL